MARRNPRRIVRLVRQLFCSASGDKGRALGMPVHLLWVTKYKQGDNGVSIRKQSLWKQSQKPSQRRQTTIEQGPFSTAKGSPCLCAYLPLSGLADPYQNKALSLWIWAELKTNWIPLTVSVGTPERYSLSFPREVHIRQWHPALKGCGQGQMQSFLDWTLALINHESSLHLLKALAFSIYRLLNPCYTYSLGRGTCIESTEFSLCIHA